VDEGRETLLVRRTLEGFPRHVLHLRADDVMGSDKEIGLNLKP
jgi:hypothetical protein